MAGIKNFVVLLGVVVLTLCERHVVRLTHKLKEQGFEEDLDFGEVVVEQKVSSSAECGQLCQAHPVCHSVMLLGQLCRMFSQLPLRDVSI